MQTKLFDPERRSAERFVVSLPVETDRGPGVTRDVSLSGLYLITDQQLLPDDRLHLVVTVPDRDNPEPLRLSLTGRVVRVEDAGGAVGAGIALDEESAYLVQAS